MPTISPVEIAVVVAAVLLLYVVPFVLTLLHGLRRRPVQEWPGSALEAARASDDVSAVHGTSPAEAATALQVPSTASAEAVAPQREDTPPAVPPSAAVRFAGYEPAVATPFPGNAGYRFRLEDLHRARLTPWPPESVQGDPARHQLWSAATRLAAAHDAAICTADLIGPCPVRSACLGACERRPTGIALHFLLFPDLWPATPQQAVARAVFEIDSGDGAIRHSLDTLQPPA